MQYTHLLADSTQHAPGPLSKIVCVGRNYAAHARELNNPVPSSPLLFIKPPSAAVAFSSPLSIPDHLGDVHHELELAILIGERLSRADESVALNAIWGYGLGLDLTLRTLQTSLKSKGHPWERAKAFDGSCPLSPFHRGSLDWSDLQIRLTVNGELRQNGHTGDMLTPVASLLAQISACFTLSPGDVVMTGTPAGVGPLHRGDKLSCELVDICRYEVNVA